MRAKTLAQVAIALVLLISLLAAPLVGDKKKRAWQSGKLVSAEQREGGAAAIPVGGIVVATKLKSWLYIIETESAVYELLWKSSKPLSVTVNAQVKFAIDEKNAGFVIDE